jgi:hypothetical protein
LIIYGVLDSHTALSHASNLRVDSYVYTREGITEAFKLLKPDGVMSIAFALPNESLGFKLSPPLGHSRRRQAARASGKRVIST